MSKHEFLSDYLGILQHYNCPCNIDYSNLDREGNRVYLIDPTETGWLQSFLNAGVLKENDSVGGNKYALTDLGKEWWKRIKAVSIPEIKVMFV